MLPPKVMLLGLTLFFFDHRSFIRNKTQTAVINMVVKRMLNNVHLHDVS